MCILLSLNFFLLLRMFCLLELKFFVVMVVVNTRVINFVSLFQTRRILQQKYCPHTFEQNDVVERKHRHVVEMTLSMLSKSSIPFWYFHFSISIFLINRLPTSSLGNKIPFEVLFSKPSDYTFLRVFGCACYLLLCPYSSHKL